MTAALTTTEAPTKPCQVCDVPVALGERTAHRRACGRLLNGVVVPSRQDRKTKSNRQRAWKRAYTARMNAGLEWCRYCHVDLDPPGRQAWTSGTFEHLVHRGRDGADAMWNVTLVCLDCNQRYACARNRHLQPNVRSLAEEEAAAPVVLRWSLVPQPPFKRVRQLLARTGTN